MKKIMAVLLILLSLLGCSNTKVEGGIESSRWFDSKKQMITNLLKEEEISANDIIDRIKLDKEEIILFKFHANEGDGVGIATVFQKDNKYKWERNLQKVILKYRDYNIETHTTLTTTSNNKYELYLGVATKPSEVISTETGDIKPTVDPKTNFYYYIKQVE
ncbi:hypothetical protein J7E81_30150 [Bacillus sp. ISL-18]|uniref:hypothetical protein n=1 Tax=Bacillus sp. ISL-18 TaxID=2819118 RepID=UPI001BEC159C|nr:hypothetical protein [Bacillus sp. ISL-18]MBT2659390.1 hypothetical protein [Bacillus sp. ISL-18]